MEVNSLNNFIDMNTLESIGLDYALGKLNTITPYGKYLKDNMKPFKIGEEELLIEELDQIKRLVNLTNENKYLFKNIKNILSNIKDLRNSIHRAVDGYILSNVELYEVKGFILTLAELTEELKAIEKQLHSTIKPYRIPELENLLDPQNTKVRAFYINDDYSQELKNIRENKKEIDNKLKLETKNLKENIEKELNIKIRPDNTITISKSNKEMLNKANNSPNLIYSSETYMDIKYSLKYTLHMCQLENELFIIKEKEEKEEENIRKELSKAIGNHQEDISKNIKAIGKLDLSLSKAYMAISTNSVKPTISKKHIVNITNGRHIEVEDILKSKDRGFTPISINLQEGVSCITGANMGGKTVSLKLVGLLCAMAQYGLFVPCSSMETGLHGFIYGSIGDKQSTDKGLSTFGSEINSIKEAIKKSEEQGLILIDELARGTNPEEGYAISKAIVNYLKSKKSITLITTHYDNIAASEDIQHYQVIGLANINYEELKANLKSKGTSMELISRYMDYRLAKVTQQTKVPRDAINIAKLMGLDQSIIEEAERILFGTVVEQ